MTGPLERQPAGAVVEVGQYGLMAEFDSAEGLLRATRQAYASGYRAMDAYAPFSVEGLAEALGVRQSAVPLIALVGGCTGVAAGFGLQYYVHVIALPMNVGGRPLDSWQAFIPVTFEMGVLFSALFTLAAVVILNRLPELYHPVFNVASFGRASRDRFFLCIEARDARFDDRETRAFLAALGALDVADVPA